MSHGEGVMGMRKLILIHGGGRLAVVAVVLGVTGCTAAPHPGAPSASGRFGVCRPGQLGAAFWGISQPGTGGTGMAVIGVWDKSPAACLLPGPVVISGLDAAARRVTTAVRLTVAPREIALTPDGRQPDKGGRTPDGQLSAWLVLEAAGNHPAGGSAWACHGRQVVPAVFRISLSAGGPLTVPNASATRGPAFTRDGGLLTCGGRLAGRSPVSITRTWPIASPAAPPSAVPAQSSGPNRPSQAPAAHLG